MTAGVYKIESPSGRFYIGSSSDIRRRWYEHTSELERGIHHARALQNAAKKYGVGALKFSVVLHCADKDLVLYEDLCIKVLRPRYNSLKFARRRDGWKPTAETRARMSASAKARKRAPMPEETKAKIAAALKAKGVVPPGNKGKPHSEATKAKLSERAKARAPRVQSAEEKAKRSESRRRYFAALKQEQASES